MHTLSEDKIKANQVEGDINLTATRKQWQDKFLSEKSKKLLDEDIDILPMPKYRGFLDTNDTCSRTAGKWFSGGKSRRKKRFPDGRWNRCTSDSGTGQTDEMRKEADRSRIP